jgi:predicted Zn-dependent protease with MMP-like domain
MRKSADPRSLDAIVAMADRALAEIPEMFRKHLDGVAIRVEDWPTEEVMEEMGCETLYDLLGLYHGIDIGHDSSFSAGGQIDQIFLYRMPILAYAEEEGEKLHDVVKHVLIHEIGHHLGLSDDDMEAIEEGTWEI